MSLSSLDLLNHANYQIYNRQIARKLGSVDAAIMLSELINRYQYHKEHNELLTFEKFEGEWFFYTVEKCEERTVLSRREQERTVKNLISNGLIEKIQFGLPAKRHFKLNIDNIEEFMDFSKNLSRTHKRCELDSTKGANWNAQKVRTETPLQAHSEKTDAHILKNSKEEPYLRTPINKKNKKKFETLENEKEGTTPVREFIYLTEQQIGDLQSRYSTELLEIMFDKLNLQHEQILQGISKRKQCYTFSIFNRNSWLWDAACKSIHSQTHTKVEKEDYKTKVKNFFKNDSIHLGATCNWNETSIGFTRGMKHEQVYWNDYNFKDNFVKMLRSFGIPIKENPTKKREIGSKLVENLITPLANNMRLNYANG